ncbi:MAG: LD-carboxypeptidase [Ignavibacteriae bacterium]|nr:LD-carboxypeptidase [Ignavibacteriota bacterium]
MHRDKIEKGIEYLLLLGFRVARGASIDSSEGYLAGTDEQRAADINAMFADPAVDAIICLRGGYGSGRILRLLDYATIRRNPKIFVGYSDITALHAALWTKCRLLTFAGPMVAADFWKGMDEVTEHAFWPLLTKPFSRYRLYHPALTPGACCLVPGICEGTLLGGNLAVLMTVIGTPYEPKWEHSILVLEDVGENVYKIDRMLSHLSNAGILKRIGALIFGRFTNIPEDGTSRELEEVLREFSSPLGIPTVCGLPVGHDNPKITLPMGARVRLNAHKCLLHAVHPVVA